MNPFDFTRRAALVTGCGSEAGIGFASARLLARLGARVTITATTDRIEARADELRTEGADITAHAADLTDRAQAFALAGAAGDVDILVNAAGLAQTGIDPVTARFRDLTPEQLERELVDGGNIIQEPHGIDLYRDAPV